MPVMHFTIEDLMEILVAKAGLPRGVATADPFATFEDIGLDSLAYLQLQGEVADTYDVELGDELLHGPFADILSLINQNLAEREGLHR